MLTGGQQLHLEIRGVLVGYEDLQLEVGDVPLQSIYEQRDHQLRPCAVVRDLQTVELHSRVKKGGGDGGVGAGGQGLDWA